DGTGLGCAHRRQRFSVLLRNFPSDGGLNVRAHGDAELANRGKHAGPECKRSTATAPAGMVAGSYGSSLDADDSDNRGGGVLPVAPHVSRLSGRILVRH